MRLRLGGLLLLALGCARAPAPASPPREAVPTSALVRVGTIGDAPSDAVEVALAAGGRIVTTSGAVDLEGLGAFLEAAATGGPGLDVDGNSLRTVVLRVHPSLPFEVVEWTLQECWDARMYRIHFAVRPEEGEDEGTMAVFLPKRLGSLDGQPPRRFRLRLRSDESAVDDGTAFAAYCDLVSANPEAEADVTTRWGIAAGLAIRTADLLLRAGAKGVSLGSSLPDVPYPRGRAPSGRTTLEEYVASHPASPRGFRIRFGDRELVGGGAAGAPPPPVARVRGRPAGSLTETVSPQKAAIGGGGARVQRWSGGERAFLARGGSDLTEYAVELGLKWLADHQDIDDDGRWDCDGFMKHDPPDRRCDGAGAPLHDVGVTGLAVLAFLQAGYTGREDGPAAKYAPNVRAGLRYLIVSQQDDGVFGTRAASDFMYDHAIATLAMCEAFWMTRNPRYKKPAQDGLNFIAMARNPYLAWRYVPRGGENDTAVTGWCLLALGSGKYAGLDIDPDAFDGARIWIDKMTDPITGQVGYNREGGPPSRRAEKQERFPPERSKAMTAVGVVSRLILGEDWHSSDAIRRGVGLCLGCPPAWNLPDGSIDMYYWFHGTLALQGAREEWRTWNRALQAAVLPHQRLADGDPCRGSWDPLDPWGDDGGRVYATALLVLCLDVYWGSCSFGVR